jgi:hypothetical protein
VTRPVRVDIVLSRSRDNTVLSRVPHMLLLEATDTEQRRTSLRVGVDVPTGRQVTLQGGRTESEYLRLGTDIDCRVQILSASSYKVWINLQDSSLVAPDGDQRLAAASAVRRYSATVSDLTVRDGEPQPFSVGTDPVTGETTRAEVTVTARK